MKIWIKTLVAIFLAIICGLFIPLSWSWVISAFDFISGFSLSFMRYILFPLIFFSLTIRCFELQKQRQLQKTLLISTSLITGSSLIFSIVGALLAFTLHRLPINALKQSKNLSIPSIQETLNQIFPDNLFQIFTTDGNFLIPLVLFSLILGTSLNFDKITTRPIAEFFDSFSALFCHINIFFSEIAGYAFFFILSSLIFQLRNTKDLVLFGEFFILLAIITLVLIFIIYPLLLFFITKRKNPYKLLFGMFTPAMGAFISGNLFFSVPISFLHNEKNLGIKHQLNGTITPITAIIGRSGTALVSSATVLFLHISYTQNISFSTVLLTIILCFLLSFFTGSLHRFNVLATVALVFQILGTTKNEYLNLIQVAPLLYCFAALIDSIHNTVITYITAHFIEDSRDKLLKEFI